MKWILCSERLPEGTNGFAKQIVTRWRFEDNAQMRVYTANQLRDITKTMIDLNKIEWLDETPTPPAVREALDVAKYMRHLPTCNKEQNWDEAFQAMAGTPDKFRDAGYYSAMEELETKRRTCTCGMEAARTALAGEGEEQGEVWEEAWDKASTLTGTEIDDLSMIAGRTIIQQSGWKQLYKHFHITRKLPTP